MAFVSELLGEIVHDKDGNKIDLKKSCAGKTVGILFSAQWCGPCNGFKPFLNDFYEKHHEKKNFEIIFASCDRHYIEFSEHYDEMPWLTLAFHQKFKKVC
jgi:nucleoredoxin